MDRRVICTFVLLLVACGGNKQSNSSVPLELFPTIEQPHELVIYLKERGYNLEEHEVVTEDNYKLVFHRMNKTKKAFKNYKIPVLLVHGLALSSAAFLTPSDEWALAFKLQEFNFDVWLVNSRGNRYSRKHKDLDPQGEEYWNFGLHEMSVLDLSAGINYILKLNDYPQLAIVGHSIGATEAIILAADRPNIQDKIVQIIALAPLLKPTKYISKSVDEEAVVNDWKQNKTEYGVFLDGKHWKHLCSEKVGNLCSVVAENSKGQKEVWPIIKRFIPAGTSEMAFRQASTIGPLIKGVEYDIESLKKFNSTKKLPHYDLSNVSVPVHIFYSITDRFVAMEDVLDLNMNLDKGMLHIVNAKTFSHFDFLWGHPANKNLYSEVVKILLAPNK